MSISSSIPFYRYKTSNIVRTVQGFRNILKSLFGHRVAQGIIEAVHQALADQEKDKCLAFTQLSSSWTSLQRLCSPLSITLAFIACYILTYAGCN